VPTNDYREVLTSLKGGDLLIPYLRNALLAENWPSTYQITIDSSPYYGLDEDGKPDGYFHPSSHGTMDERKLYYFFHPYHRDRLMFEHKTIQDEMTLSMGSALHGVLQTQFQMAGILRPENVEVEFFIPEHHVRGRTDMVIDHPTEGPLVTEFKTQNSRAFNFQEEMKDFWQVQLSLALYGLGYTRGVLLVLESGFPYRMREYQYERDDELLAKVFAKFDYVRECIAADTPPPFCCSKGSAQMKKCPARYECWQKDEVIK